VTERTRHGAHLYLAIVRVGVHHSNTCVRHMAALQMQASCTTSRLACHRQCCHASARTALSEQHAAHEHAAQEVCVAIAQRLVDLCHARVIILCSSCPVHQYLVSPGRICTPHTPAEHPCGGYRQASEQWATLCRAARVSMASLHRRCSPVCGHGRSQASGSLGPVLDTCDC
jgi:hypothetical protein